MRFLLCRTDKTIGDLVVSLPIHKFILDNFPAAEIFWMTRPELAPILDNIPGIAGVLHRLPDSDLVRLIRYINPDVLLNIGHRNMEIIPAAKMAGVPMRIAIPRGLKQAFDATHRIWQKRTKSGRHESQLVLDYLKPLGLFVSDVLPPPPQLMLTPEEIARGLNDLHGIPVPRLGVITRGVTGAYPSQRWWKKMLEDSKVAGWNPVILSPPDECSLPPTNLRGLMSRLYACNAVLGISTGPAHLAAALNVPTLCLMPKSLRHGPVRWAPMGNRAEALACPGQEVALGSGMDRFSPDTVLAHLDKLLSCTNHLSALK